MPERRQPWHVHYHAHRYLILMGATLAILLVRPLLAQDFVSSFLLDLVAGLLCLGFLVLQRWWRSLAVCTTLVAASGLSAFVMYDHWDAAPAPVRRFLGGCSIVLTILFLTYLSVLVLRDIFSDPARSWDNVYGALFVYFLAGIVFANIYLVIYVGDRNAFNMSPSGQPVGPEALISETGDFVYYSFVTLATLGYGDITPLTRLTRTLSWMEAVLGQFFLAVFVARLIAAQTPHRGDHGRPAGEN